MDRQLQQQAHQLFIEESLELMQQVRVDLSELSVNFTAKSFERLLEAVQIINGGAIEVNLTDLQIPVKRFEMVLLSIEESSAIALKDSLHIAQSAAPNAIAPDCLSNLQEIYDEIWECLFPYLPTYQSELETSKNSLERQTNEFVGVSHRSLVESPQQAKNEGLQMDLLEVTIQKDLPLALERLEKALKESSDRDFLVKEITTVVEFIFKLSETWQDYDLVGNYFDLWSSLSETSQSTISSIAANPQSAREIGNSALSSWRNSYRLAIEKYFPIEEDKEKTNFTNPIENHSQIIKKTLSTAKSFLWLSGFNLFVLPADSIEEIVNPNVQNIIISGDRRFLIWKQKEIKLYKISELLHYKYPLPRTAIESSENNSLQFTDESWQTLIVNLGREIIAIEPEVDRFIVKSKLEIESIERIFNIPNYIYGCTFLEDELPRPVIDVKILLNFHLEADRNISVVSPTILIIDDSKTMREIVNCTLEKEGYRVIKASDGREAIEKLEENPQIQGIICDLEMPIISGFALLKYRSTHPTFCNLPLIVLTNHNSEEDRQLALQLGATSYLTIPYQESELLAILKHLLT
jgi:CheY-like chemotaxis protein/chemotaxis protein histidine kinase CheA